MRVPILLTLIAWLTVSGAFVRADMADGLAAFDARLAAWRRARWLTNAVSPARGPSR